MNAKKTALIAAAAAGIPRGLRLRQRRRQAGRFARRHVGHPAPATSSAPAAPAAKHAQGPERLQGPGGCKSDKNACKGQNVWVRPGRLQDGLIGSTKGASRGATS